MTHPLSERQQLKVLLQTTTPSTEISALSVPISPTRYLTWSTARRRAWDRRHSSPNSYFLHYLHPNLRPCPVKWSLEEHRTFLAALRRAPPSDQWGLFSLLVPGRIGSECRRYYHRIGRAGFINLDGKVRTRLVSKAKVMDGKTVLESPNPLFLRRSLRKFVPRSLPSIEDALYKSLEKPSEKKRSANKPSAVRSNLDPGKRKSPADTRDAKATMCVLTKSRSSEKLSSCLPAQSSVSVVDPLDMLTYVPAKPSEYDGQPPSDHNQDKDFLATAAVREESDAVPCRLRVRQSSEIRCLSNHQSSIKSRARLNQKTAVVSLNKSRRTGDGPVKSGSVKVKMRRKAPNSGSSSAKDSISVTVAGAKRKESKKTRKMKKSNQKALKNEKKEEKENHIDGRSQLSRRMENSQRSVAAVEGTEVLQESRKQGKGKIGKQAGRVWVPPSHDNQTGGDLTKRKRKSVKLLKPILKSKDASKKRREHARTVHFSQTEGQGKEAAAQNELVRDADTFPGQKNPDVVPLVFSQESPESGQASIDGKRYSSHEIDLEIDMIDDISRGTQKASASISAAWDTGSMNNANKFQEPVVSSFPVSCRLDNGPKAQQLKKKTVPVKQEAYVPAASPQKRFSHQTTRQAQSGFDDMPLAPELDRPVNSVKMRGCLGKTTPELLHVGSFAEEPDEQPFENMSEDRVEITHSEQSAAGNDGQSTGTDGELLDIGAGMETPPRNETENVEPPEETGELGSKLINSRRISGPTRGDRTSIGFLMNEDSAESPQKRRKYEHCESSIDVGGNDDVEKPVALDSDGDVTATREEGCKDSPAGKGTTSVLNDAPPKVESEYQVMQRRVEQTRLLLRLFIDDVDAIGEQLSHKRQRLTLLESFEESLRWIRLTEGQAAKKRPLYTPPLLRAANTAAELDNGTTESKHHKIHLGGVAQYWGAFVDTYMERLNEMESRQKTEVEGKHIADSISKHIS